MENKNFDEIRFYRDGLLNLLSDSVVYGNWNDDFARKHSKEAYENVCRAISDLWTSEDNFTIKQAKELGFRRFIDAEKEKAELDELIASDKISEVEYNEELEKIEKTKDLYLIPIYLYGALPDGLEVVSISGKTKVVGKDHIDNDNRFGLLAYGLKLEK